MKISRRRLLGNRAGKASCRAAVSRIGELGIRRQIKSKVILIPIEMSVQSQGFVPGTSKSSRGFLFGYHLSEVKALRGDVGGQRRPPRAAKFMPKNFSPVDRGRLIVE
jgi:hypothetical protein